MNHIKLFEAFEKKKKIKNVEVHSLSGVALVVENRLLLVRPAKYKNFKNMWSIPKGHIEGDSLESALKELKEETGIILDKEFDSTFVVDYKKGGVSKIMDIYVYYKTKEDIQSYIGTTDWKISNTFYDVTEIDSAKFLTEDESRQKIEFDMIGVLDDIFLV